MSGSQDSTQNLFSSSLCSFHFILNPHKQDPLLDKTMLTGYPIHVLETQQTLEGRELQNTHLHLPPFPFLFWQYGGGEQDLAT